MSTNAKENSIKMIIYSDGGCIGNPGPGGWGTIIVRENLYTELGGHAPATTNNRMEMSAAIEGLKKAQKGEEIEIITDSKYLIDGATKWIHGWKKKNWVKSDKKPVLNRDLWEIIDQLQSQFKVKWTHVRGHQGHPENERCDDIANGFARGTPPELMEGDGSWIEGGVSYVTKKPATKTTKKHTKKAAKKTAPLKGDTTPYLKPLYLSNVGGAIETHETWAACDARI
jgi:ribonuclease HI